MKFGQEDSVSDTYVFEVNGEPTLEEITPMIDELIELFGVPDEYGVNPWAYNVRRTKQQFNETLDCNFDGTWHRIASDETEPTISFLVMFSDEVMAARFKLAYC